MPPEFQNTNFVAYPRRHSMIETRHPDCPRCGEMLVAPLHTEFRGRGCIQHYWACEACGEASETSVSFVAH